MEWKKEEKQVRWYKTELGIRQIIQQFSIMILWHWCVMDIWERKYGVTKIFWGNFMETSCLPYQGGSPVWGEYVGQWMINNFKCYLCFIGKKKKVENLCSFNAHTDLCRHKCGSKFCRSRKKIVLLLSAEERLKRFSFIGNENLSK